MVKFLSFLFTIGACLPASVNFWNAIRGTSLDTYAFSVRPSAIWIAGGCTAIAVLNSIFVWRRGDRLISISLFALSCAGLAATPLSIQAVDILPCG